MVVADTSRGLPPQTRGILSEQPVLVMPTMQAKIDAQVRGLGCGYLPVTLAAPWRKRRKACPDGACGRVAGGAAGRGVKWWLEKLKSPRLCESLLGLG